MLLSNFHSDSLFERGILYSSLASPYHECLYVRHPQAPLCRGKNVRYIEKDSRSPGGVASQSGGFLPRSSISIWNVASVGQRLQTLYRAPTDLARSIRCANIRIVFGLFLLLISNMMHIVISCIPSPILWAVALTSKDWDVCSYINPSVHIHTLKAALHEVNTWQHNATSLISYSTRIQFELQWRLQRVSYILYQYMDALQLLPLILCWQTCFVRLRNTNLLEGNNLSYITSWKYYNRKTSSWSYQFYSHV